MEDKLHEKNLLKVDEAENKNKNKFLHSRNLIFVLLVVPNTYSYEIQENHFHQRRIYRPK